MTDSHFLPPPRKPGLFPLEEAEKSMWLFTTRGFYSAVSLDGGATIMVRARVRRDLEHLRARLPDPAPRIEDSPQRDYPYRLFIVGG